MIYLELFKAVRNNSLYQILEVLKTKFPVCEMLQSYLLRENTAVSTATIYDPKSNTVTTVWQLEKTQKVNTDFWDFGG